MTDEFSVSPIPESPLPAPVRSPEEEREAASVLAEVQSRLDAIERRRTELTKPMNDALKEWNGKAREAATPYEAMKDTLKSLLTGWRGSKEFRELYAARSAAEWRFKEAEREEDVKAMTVASAEYKSALALAPKSVPAGEGHVIRYRTDVVFDSIDESQVPAQFWKRELDMTALKKAVKDGLDVPGITAHEVMSPAVYSADSKE
jgi:hypothetical protein